MCEWGSDTVVRVKVAADLSWNGKETWKDFKIDSCIASLVKALQKGGIDMRSSCCGHGNNLGSINLQDGRTLFIKLPTDEDGLE